MNALDTSRVGLAALAAGLMAVFGACAGPEPAPTATPAPVALVVIEPGEVTLQVGEWREFRVAALDRFEKPISPDLVAFTFEIAEGVGYICSDPGALVKAGHFIATRPGTVTVRVNARGLLTASPPPLVSPSPTPSSRPFTRVPPSATATVTVVPRDSGGLAAFSPEARNFCWDPLRAGAQEEGEVVIFVGGSLGRSNLKDLLPKFEDEYGIKVNFFSGSSRQMADKILAERAARKYLLDVFMGVSGMVGTRLVSANALRPVEPLLFHPEVVDRSAWLDGRFHWLDADTQRYVFAFAANASKADITYNTDLVSQEEIDAVTSIWDLLDPKWKGLIIIRDPRLPEVAAAVLDYFLHPDVGEEFLRRLLTEMDITMTEKIFGNDARQAAEQLALGKFAICLFACRTAVLEREKQGASVEADFPHYLRVGGRLSAGSGTLSLMDTPPHPSAQRFFANWWLSKEGQEMMQRASGNDSTRIDIPKDTVAPDSRREVEKEVFYTWSETRPTYTQDLIDVQAFVTEVLAAIGNSP